VRIGPAAGDQPAVPAQQRLRLHQEGAPRAARQHPAQRRQQHSVVWLEPRPVDLPAKDRKLVAEQENLELLRSIAASDEHDQLQQAADDDVQGRHKQRRPPADADARRYRRLSSPRDSSDRVSAPHAWNYSSSRLRHLGAALCLLRSLSESESVGSPPARCPERREAHKRGNREPTGRANAAAAF
jgi:hypothetical protein